MEIKLSEILNKEIPDTSISSQEVILPITGCFTMRNGYVSAIEFKTVRIDKNGRIDIDYGTEHKEYVKKAHRVFDDFSAIEVMRDRRLSADTISAMCLRDEIDKALGCGAVVGYGLNRAYESGTLLDYIKTKIKW